MDTQNHAFYCAWIHFSFLHILEVRRKTIWSEPELNPGPLASPATSLTTRLWLLGRAISWLIGMSSSGNDVCGTSEWEVDSDTWDHRFESQHLSNHLIGAAMSCSCGRDGWEVAWLAFNTNNHQQQIFRFISQMQRTIWANEKEARLVVAAQR